MKRMYFVIPILLGLLLNTSCEEKKKVVEEKKFEEPKQLISPKFAEELNKRYNAERHKLISSVINREDANAIWYSIEELENYINYVKKEGEKQKIKVDGIRFYLGVYPDDAKTYGNKAGLTTIFLTPTENKVIQKGSMINLSAMQDEKQSVDVTKIAPDNYGGMGDPPKQEYVPQS
jgi:DNA polymerase sigma